MSSNGKLPASALAPITIGVQDGKQAYLRKDAAKAFMAMNAESERRYHLTLRPTSARVAYRTFAEQLYFWNLYKQGKGSLAAQPGSSNHGLGITVDFASTDMRRVVDAIGAKYGWSKSWSDAPGEWWHVMWRADKVTADLTPDPLAGYPADEKRWIAEYDHLLRAGKDKARRRVLRRVMTERRQSIYHAAGGTKAGWAALRRRARYASLYARTA